MGKLNDIYFFKIVFLYVLNVTISGAAHFKEFTMAKEILFTDKKF